ncbi:hypothetical protein HYV84_04210 [Candidatus Woesearchaeota archaeon]|nr:hypothetical protein [Candidatus Woesearchaeota archaeon]
MIDQKDARRVYAHVRKEDYSSRNNRGGVVVVLLGALLVIGTLGFFSYQKHIVAGMASTVLDSGSQPGPLYIVNLPDKPVDGRVAVFSRKILPTTLEIQKAVEQPVGADGVAELFFSYDPLLEYSFMVTSKNYRRSSWGPMTIKPGMPVSENFLLQPVRNDISGDTGKIVFTVYGQAAPVAKPVKATLTFYDGYGAKLVKETNDQGILEVFYTKEPYSITIENQRFLMNYHNAQPYVDAEAQGYVKNVKAYGGTWPHGDISQGVISLGRDCQLLTCQQLGKTCGKFDNGCGSIVDCGTCPTLTVFTSFENKPAQGVSVYAYKAGTSADKVRVPPVPVGMKVTDPYGKAAFIFPVGPLEEAIIVAESNLFVKTISNVIVKTEGDAQKTVVMEKPSLGATTTTGKIQLSFYDEQTTLPVAPKVTFLKRDDPASPRIIKNAQGDGKLEVTFQHEPRNVVIEYAKFFSNPFPSRTVSGIDFDVEAQGFEKQTKSASLMLGKVTSVSVPLRKTVSGCAPKTCAGLGIACGPAEDGCGTRLTCGSCSAYEQCSEGKCQRLQSCCTDVDFNCDKEITARELLDYFSSFGRYGGMPTTAIKSWIIKGCSSS